MRSIDNFQAKEKFPEIEAKAKIKEETLEFRKNRKFRKN